MFLVQNFEKKYEEEGLFIFYISLENDFLIPIFDPIIGVFACQRITEKEEEAFFIFLF